jgi:hypothetical protein
VALASLACAALVASVGPPRGLAVSVVAPEVVVAGLGQQAGAPGVQLSAASSVRSARDHLAHGLSDAAIDVDLGGARDGLLLDGRRSDELTAAITEQVTALEAAQGRTVVARVLDLPGAPRAVPRRLTLLALTLGFVLAAVPSVLVGAVPRSIALGARRLLLVGVAAAVGAVLLCWWQQALRPDAVAVVWLAAAGIAAAVLAVEALFAISGLVVAASLAVTFVAPLAVAPDLAFLPLWLQAGYPWTPPGAAAAALAQVLTFDVSEARQVVLCVGWLAVAVATIGVARHFRPPDARHGTSAWRLRVAGVTAAFASAVVVAAVLVPSGQPALPAASADVVALDTLAPCTPLPRVRTVADLNRVMRMPDVDGLVGADVGLDVALQDDRRLWLFGDTLRADAAPVRNSMVLRDGNCLHAVVTPDRGAVIPDRDLRVGYWPMSVGAVSRTGYDLVAVGAQRVRASGAGPFDFETLGSAVAVFVVPVGGAPQLVARQDVGSDDSDSTRPTWAAAAAVDRDMVYLYGTSRAADGSSLGFSVRVARTRVDDLLDSPSWRFWDGVDWSPYPEAAAEVIPAAGGVSQTFSVFEQDGTWYALSKQDEFVGQHVHVWTADQPWGPFLLGPVVATLPSDTAAGELVYMPLAHPTLLPEQGTVVISYSRNQVDVGRVFRDPQLYRPRFLRVRLPAW